MSTGRNRRVIDAALREGRSLAEAAGIHLADRPAPLYRLSVVALLVSARISTEVALAAARELFAAGMGTPKGMLGASWQERVDALGRAHYRRYDERTATMLGDGAELIRGEWGGDLRRIRPAGGDTGRLRADLERLPGVGPAGSAIFCREVQGVWPEVFPFVDEAVARGARTLHLPHTARGLARYVGAAEMPRLAAALVRAPQHAGELRAA